jgi:hypothetical protein
MTSVRPVVHRATARRWAGWLVLAVVGLGCRQVDVEPSCVLTTRRFEHFLAPGEPANVTVSLSEACFDGTSKRVHIADAVTAEVFNPAGEKVPSTVSGLSWSKGRAFLDNTATVSFTPDQPGTWLIQAKFEPSIGNATLSIEALNARSDAGVRVVAVGLLPADCQQYGLTRSGVALCTRAPAADPQVLYASGGQEFAATGFAVDENSVWMLPETAYGGVTVVGTARVSRWEEVGGAFERTHLFSNGVRSGSSMVATRGDLWVGAGSTTAPLLNLRLEPDGGAARAELGPLPWTVTALVVPVAGDAVNAFGFPPTERDFVPRASIATLRRDAGFQTFFLGFEQLAGVEDGAFWSWSVQDETTALSVSQPIGERLVRATLPLPKGFIPLGPAVLNPSFPLVPLSSEFSGDLRVIGEAAVPRFDGTKIWLDVFDPGPDYFPVTSASPTHVFARSRDGKTLKVFER